MAIPSSSVTSQTKKQTKQPAMIMDVFPVSESEGVRDGRGREGSETGDEPDWGVEEDSWIAGEGVRKILFMKEDVRNVQWIRRYWEREKKIAGEGGGRSRKVRSKKYTFL